jgi:cytochrome c-type biogenesis protein CcmH
LENLFWASIGFFIAIGLMLILMPHIFPLLKETYDGDKSTVKRGSLKPWLLILPVIVGAGFLYYKLGSPNAASVTKESQPIEVGNKQSAMPMAPNHEMGDLSAMAEKLAKKLEKDPSNGEGWALLARSYVELKQHQKAVPAFEKAVNLLPQDAQLLADYVDARAITQNHQLDDKSAELINKALSIDPNHPKALMLSGTLAFDHGDYKKAITIWEHLQGTLKGEETVDLQNQLLANISEAKRLIEKSQNS